MDSREDDSRADRDHICNDQRHGKAEKITNIPSSSEEMKDRRSAQEKRQDDYAQK